MVIYKPKYLLRRLKILEKKLNLAITLNNKKQIKSLSHQIWMIEEDLRIREEIEKEK